MPKESKRPRGRPKSGNPRDERVYLRATPDELARWRSAAKKRGLTFSAWLRQVLDRSAARVGK